MIISAFCVAGSHSVVIDPDGDPSAVQRVPEGWALVRASVITGPRGPNGEWTPGIWFYDADSDTQIVCCAEHVHSLFAVIGQ